MTAKKRKCLFSGAEALHTQNGEIITINSSVIGRYDLSIELAEIFGQEIQNNNGEIPDPDQAKINCALKCLEVNSNKKSFSLWVPRAYFDKYLDLYKSSPQVVVCCYEEISNESVNHAKKPKLLLESFSRRLDKSRAYSEFKISPEDRIWAQIVDDDELAQVLSYLKDKELVTFMWPEDGNKFKPVFLGIILIRMTVDGWAYIEKESPIKNTNKVFIAAQFEWAENPGMQSQAIKAIKDACKDCGYDANLVGQDHTDSITNKIMSEIKDSKFVIAELTYNNRGVYFESGYARGLGKPVFHVVKKGHTEGDDSQGKRIHFDIRQVMFREWETTDNLKEILKEWIKVTVGVYDEK